MNRTAIGWFHLTVADGANGTGPPTFPIGPLGRWKVPFLPSRDQALTVVFPSSTGS